MCNEVLTLHTSRQPHLPRQITALKVVGPMGSRVVWWVKGYISPQLTKQGFIRSGVRLAKRWPDVKKSRSGSRP